MAILSKAQMRMYAAAAGFPNPSVMAEVGYAESGGKTDVVNSIGCVGILQINQPVHVKSHPTWTVAWLKDPLNNFRAGKVLYDADKRAGGTGLRPWEDSRLKGNGGGWGKTATATQAGLFGDDDPLDNFWDGILGDQKRGPGSEQWDNANPQDPFGLGLEVPGIDGLDSLSGLLDLAKLGVKAGEWMSNPRNWLNVLYVVTGGALVLATLSATVRQQVMGSVKVLGKKVAG